MNKNILIGLLFLVLCSCNNTSTQGQKNKVIGEENKEPLLELLFEMNFDKTPLKVYADGVLKFDEIVTTEASTATADFTEIPKSTNIITMVTDKDTISIFNQGKYEFILVGYWKSKLKAINKYEKRPKNLRFD